MKRWLALLLALLCVAAGGERLPEAVRKALEMNSRKAAVALLEKEAPGAPPAEAPWILLYAGELRRLLGDGPEARRHFEAVAADYPASPAKDAAVLGMALVDAGGRPGGNPLATMELVGDKGVPATMNVDRYLLLARVRQDEGAPAADVRALLDKAAGFAGDDKDLARRVEKASAAAPGEAGGGAPVGPPDLVALEKIRAALAAQRWDDVPGLADDFMARFAGSPFEREIAYARKRAQSRVPPDTAKVAVLLPLTGSFAIPGGNLKTAIELGNRHAGGRLELVFHDTAGKPETCIATLEKAVIEGGAGVVLGPLLKEEALQCAPAAQALRVPMLTFTSSPEVLAAGDLVFRAFPSVEQQVDVLLREAYDVRGLDRYAILHPSTPAGENAARVFEQAVVARGGAIARKIAYDPAATDFRSVAKTLGQKDYKARASEFARLKKEAEKNKQDPDKVTLPPIIDYDAIFVPDAYQRVALVASALAFEEFPIGKFRPRRDDTPMPLLGLNAWNNDDLARRGGTYVQDCIFVDAFDPRADGAATVGFVSAWKERAQSDPSVLEAVGYDTVRLVALAVEKSPRDAAAGLHAVTLDGAVAGTRGFGDDGELERDWRLLTVTKDGIGPLQPPEPPPVPEAQAPQ
ncbi:MAG: penicillin-binding protein activator [Myxococcota bacterium]